VRDGKPEVPGLGVLSLEGRQDLHLVPNFDSQLQSCFKQHEQPEVLGLGDVLPLGGLLDLYHGVVHAVWEESRETRQEVLSASSSQKLTKKVKMNMLAHDCGPTLSEKILLHNDAALLGIDFVKELVVENQVWDSFQWSWISTFTNTFPSLQPYLVGLVGGLESSSTSSRSLSLLCQVFWNHLQISLLLLLL
jgi:hypothetical protein